MLGYCLKRLGTAFLVALFVSILSFVLLRMSGDIAIAIAGEGAQEADIEAMGARRIAAGDGNGLARGQLANR